jgi:hypothetical protein
LVVVVFLCCCGCVLGFCVFVCLVVEWFCVLLFVFMFGFFMCFFCLCVEFGVICLGLVVLCCLWFGVV